MCITKPRRRPTNSALPPLVPCVVGLTSSESCSLATSDDRSTYSYRPGIVPNNLGDGPSITTNDTPKILVSSPGSKIVDDSWPTLDSVFDEIDVQKSRLEAERSLFGLAASEAEHQHPTAEAKPEVTTNQGAKVLKKKSPKKLKHDYRDTPLYQDHSREQTIDSKKAPSKRVSFPLKLHRVLAEIEADGLSDVVGWQPHGRAFLVHDADRFRSEILPRYFDNAKQATYLRQLNLYGFQRLRKGADRDGYYHEYFLKGREDLTAHMARTRIKGTGVRQASNPEMEPNFYRMKPVVATNCIPREEQAPKFPRHEIGMERKRLATIIQPSPELSATSPIVHNDVVSDVSENPSSSTMYDAYLETSPPVPLPPVSGKKFLKQNAASFIVKSAHCQVGKDVLGAPSRLPPTPYQRQVSDDDVPMEDSKPSAMGDTLDELDIPYQRQVSDDDVPTEDSKPSAMGDTLDELDTFFSELDRDLAFLAKEEGQTNHLEDDIAFSHLLDQMVVDI